VSVTWQKIFEDALHVAIVCVLPQETKLLNADILAGNVVRQWLRMSVSHVSLYQWWANWWLPAYLVGLF